MKYFILLNKIKEKETFFFSCYSQGRRGFTPAREKHAKIKKKGRNLGFLNEIWEKRSLDDGYEISQQNSFFLEKQKFTVRSFKSPLRWRLHTVRAYRRLRDK